MLFPAKQRICPSAHTNLCLATNPSGGSGAWDRSIWEERTPSGSLWRSSPPTSSCCSEKPSTRGAAAMRSVSASSPRTPRLICRTRSTRSAARTAPRGTGLSRPRYRDGAAAAATGGYLPHGYRSRALSQVARHGSRLPGPVRAVRHRQG